jgi:hypothetical protein|tara:strand:+ start:757 stop:1026 length:270 start_codon:yes stop_codon:yes gene_type:complete
MPLYSFESERGDVVEQLVPIGTEQIDIDGKAYARQSAPEGFVLVGASGKTHSQAEQVKDGYYKLEQTEGSRFLKKSQFTTKQIKKAWGF